MPADNPEKTEALPSALNLDRSAGDFSFAEDYAYNAGTGLNADVVRYISRVKDEDPWVLDFRLKALERFEKMANPTHWATKKLDDLDVGVTGEDVDAVGDGVVAFGPLKKTQDFIFGAWTMTVNVPGMASTSRIDANGHVAYVMMMTMGGTRFCNASAYATDAQSKLCADWRDGKI